MDNYLWKNYISFQKELINRIQSHEILPRDDCFLIEENDWERFIYNKINPYNQTKNNILYIHKKVEFIENISSALKILKNNKKIKLVKKDLIAALYKVNDLIYLKSFNYYCGNNKLLIEFNENYSCMALLILNPLDSIINNSKHLYVIAFRTLNHLKENLYINLLSQEIVLNYDILNNLEYNNIIITKFNGFINIDGMYPIEEYQIIRNNNIFKDNNILTIFICIFYYEKYLSIYREKTFDENESYFLINPQWLEYYKDFYNYNNKLFGVLKNISSNYTNNLINYKNLDRFILNISNDLNNFILEKRKGEINFEYIIPNPTYIKNNIVFYENCFIFDKKIIDMMLSTYSNLNKNIANLSYKIRVKNKFIYLIDINSNSVSIGCINGNLLFNPKLLIFYNNFIILEREFNLLFQKTIKEYIKLRKCSETYKINQLLIEGKNNKIGNLVVLKVDEFKSKQITDNKKIKLEKGFNKNKEISEYKTIFGNYVDICLKKKIYNKSKSMYHSNINNMRDQYSRNSIKIPKHKNLEDYNVENIETQINKNNIYNKRKNFSKKRNKKDSQPRKNKNNNELDIIKYKFGELPKEKIDLEEYQENKDFLNESKEGSFFDEIKRLKENNLYIQKNLEKEKKLKEELDKNNKILKQKENIYQKKIKEYEKKEKDINEDYNKLKEKLKEKKIEILLNEEKYNKKINELESQKNKVEKENKRIKDERNNLNKKKGELNKINSEIQEKLKNEIQLKDELIKENQILKDKEINYINKIKYYENNEKEKVLLNKIKSLENENNKIKEEKENLNKKNKELESHINSQKIKNDNLLSEIKNNKLMEESNKNFEKLLNEKIKENENLRKNSKKLIDEVLSEKEKELLDKDNKLKELKEQNEKLNQINKEKNNEIKLLKNNNKNNEEKLKNKYENQLKQKEEELNNIKKEYKNKEEEFNKINNELNNILSNNKKTLVQNQKEIGELKLDIESKNDEIKKLNLFNKNKGEEKEKELDNIIRENSDLKIYILNREKELENEKKIKDKLNKENEALKLKENELKDIIKENGNKQKEFINKENELNNKIISLENQINTINNGNKEIKNKNGILEDENKKIINEKNDLNKKYLEIKKLLENKDKELENKNNIINQNKKEKVEFISKEKKVQESMKKLEDEIKEKDQKIKQTEGNLKIKENEIIKSNKEINEINKKLEISNKSIEKLEKINFGLNQNIKEKENEIIKLNNEKIEKDTEISKLINEKIEKETEIENLLTKNAQLNDDKSKILKEREEQNRIINELNQWKNEKEIEYESKVKDFEIKGKNDENMNKKREIELDEREIELNKKEKDLENKKKLIEKENNEMKDEREKFEKDKDKNEKINKEILDLIEKKVNLEKEINDKNNMIIQMNNYMNNNINYGNMYNNNCSVPMNNNYFINNNINNFNNLNGNNYIANVFNDILITYKFPTLIGLNNIGATCFMNSTLQCLSQTKILTNYFLNDKNKERIINNNLALKNKSETQLSPAYLELITKLWEKNGTKSFSPNNFMGIVEKMNPLFKKGQAGDSKDFIIFILEQLHKELKKTNYNNNINVPLNQYDRQSAQNYFFNDFNKEGSILSENFFGFNETTNECLYCKNISFNQGISAPICYNYGLFNCLIFPLEEVKNMKNNYYQMPKNNVVTIYECFIYNQKTDLFSGDNKNYCNICKQLADSNYTSRIFKSPNILILILNRGRNNIYNVKLNFTEKIDITPYVLQKDRPQLIYDLYAVISHIGESGPNAHFVASCKSPIDNKWYRYNDAFVNPITDLQKEVIDFSIPYILFYQKV